MFCAHPPFQIDGNFGGTAGIAEMLIQSHDGFIEFIPAIPSEWANGSFKGLRVRGGAEVSAEWSNFKLHRVEISATAGNSFKIKIPINISTVYIDGKAVDVEDGFVLLSMKNGEKIEVRFE